MKLLVKQVQEEVYISNNITNERINCPNGQLFTNHYVPLKIK